MSLSFAYLYFLQVDCTRLGYRDAGQWSHRDYWAPFPFCTRKENDS